MAIQSGGKVFQANPRRFGPLAMISVGLIGLLIGVCGTTMIGRWTGAGGNVKAIDAEGLEPDQKVVVDSMLKSSMAPQLIEIVQIGSPVVVQRPGLVPPERTLVFLSMEIENPFGKKILGRYLFELNQGVITKRTELNFNGWKRVVADAYGPGHGFR